MQALCYGRIRKGGTGDDWGRVERQSIVLEAMFTKVQEMSASELIGLMQKLVPYVTTSLSPTEIAPLIVGAVKDGVPTLEHTRVPLDGEWDYYGASSEYILYDLDVAADHIHEYIYNDVFPGDTASTSSTDSSDSGSTDTSNEPLAASIMTNRRPHRPPQTIPPLPTAMSIPLPLRKRADGTIRQPEITTIPMEIVLSGRLRQSGVLLNQYDPYRGYDTTIIPPSLMTKERGKQPVCMLNVFFPTGYA